MAVEFCGALGVGGAQLMPYKVAGGDAGIHFVLCRCAHVFAPSFWDHSFQLSAARSNSAISNFFIFNIACWRSASRTSGSGELFVQQKQGLCKNARALCAIGRFCPLFRSMASTIF